MVFNWWLNLQSRYVTMPEDILIAKTERLGVKEGVGMPPAFSE